jgi:ribonucleoside-diphosphate reductase alpha chain
MIAVDEFHKCFDYDTEITTNLGNLKIGDIVTNKTKCLVLSYSEHTKQMEWKPVTNWFANEVKSPMIELTIQQDNGDIKTIKCTLNHKIYTLNRGWVSASDLTEEDDIVENFAFM